MASGVDIRGKHLIFHLYTLFSCIKKTTVLRICWAVRLWHSSVPNKQSTVFTVCEGLKCTKKGSNYSPLKLIGCLLTLCCGFGLKRGLIIFNLFKVLKRVDKIADEYPFSEKRCFATYWHNNKLRVSLTNEHCTTGW